MKQIELVNAIASIELSTKNKEQIRQTLDEAYLTRHSASKNASHHSIKHAPRFAIAAALALCLIGIPLTSYAAIHYNWFSLFFREEKNTSALKELEQYITPMEETLETADLKINLLGNLYSEEQNMGILLCSLHFQKDGDEDAKRLWIDMGKEKDAKYDVGYTCYLTPSGTESLGTDTDKLTEPSSQKNDYSLVSEETLISTYYDGTMAEDGGYLLGIRYNDALQSKHTITLQKQTVEDGRITMSSEATLTLPRTTTGKLPLKEYTCKENGSKILLSPIGIRFTNLKNENREDKNPDMEIDMEWLNTVGLLHSTYFMTNDKEAVWLSDIATDGSLQEKSSDNIGQFYVQQEFCTLLHPDDIASIRIFEEDKGLKRTADEMDEPYKSYDVE